MARYRQIDQRIWNDEKFFSLSNDGKLLFFYLLTCPAMTMLGAAPVRAEAVAIDLGWDSKRYAIPYGELYSRGMVEYDQRGLFWVRNFLKYNPPANPKVVIGYGALLDALPECGLLYKVIQNLGKLCESRGGDYEKAYVKGFPERFRNGMAYGMANHMANQRTENREQRTEEITPVGPLTDQLIESPSHPEEQTAATETKVRATRTPIVSTKKPNDLSEQTWNDWVVQRRAKKAAITETVIAEFRSQAEKAGITLEEAVKCSLLRDWRGFKAAWYLKDQNQAARSNYETAEERRMRELNESAASTIRMPSAWIEAEDGTLKAIYEEEERYAAEG